MEQVVYDKVIINRQDRGQVADLDLIMQDLVEQEGLVERLVLLGQVDQQAVMEAVHQ